jgi:hypothetical protein
MARASPKSVVSNQGAINDLQSCTPQQKPQNTFAAFEAAFADVWYIRICSGSHQTLLLCSQVG